jgi:uncharacterized protein YjbI with pentapeptide repeats
MNPEELLVQYAAGDRQFSQCQLDDVDLSDTKLTNINLSGAKLNRANLRGSDLAIADLAMAQLCGAALTAANLQRADACGADFSDANLSNADLQGTLLRQARLERVNASQADFRQAVLTGANLIQAKLQSTDLTSADLVVANLSGAELRQAQLVRANLQGANLQGANLRWADLSGADLRGADLTGAVLSGATLTGANLSQATLINTTLVHADLTRASLMEVDWTGADLTGAQLTGVKLYNCRRFGANFNEVNCRWLDLSPNGDRTETYQFATDNPYEFFYRATPTVEILVDEALNIESNSALAVIYQRLARQLKTTLPTPQISVHRRRTVLTFAPRQDEKLFTIAYLMVFPFADATISHQSLTELLKSISSESLKAAGISLSNFQQLVAHLNQHRQKMNSDPQLQSLFQSVQKLPFFQAPTRVQLLNSDNQQLLIYSSSDLGRRSLMQAATANGQLEKPAFHQPTPAAVVEFIRQFRWHPKKSLSRSYRL